MCAVLWDILKEIRNFEGQTCSERYFCQYGDSGTCPALLGQYFMAKQDEIQ